MSRPRWEAHESLDRTVLDRLRALGREIGSDVIGDAIGAYRTASVGALAEMRAAIGSGDADALRRAAHKLKGGSLQLGANRVAAIATELEERGRAGAAAGAGPLLAQLERELGVAQDELAKERGAS